MRLKYTITYYQDASQEVWEATNKADLLKKVRDYIAEDPGSAFEWAPDDFEVVIEEVKE